MALATPLSSGIQVNLIEQNTDTLLSVKAHNADFVLGEKTLKLWAHSPDGYYSITDYSIEGSDSLTIPLSNIHYADSSGEVAYLDLVAFTESMGLVGSDNAIPAKAAQRIEDLPSEDISSFSRGSEGFVFPNRRILD